MTQEPVLYVDLDGSLVATNLLHESFLVAIKRSPWVLVQCFGWLLGGRSRLKEELAARGPVDAASLPYRESVLAFLREERARGRRLVLATASWSSHAQAVAQHLGIFDDVVSTSRDHNLKGEVKARALAERSGAEGFDYLGDSRADFPVWSRSRHAYVVDAGGDLAASMPAGVDVKRVFHPDKPLPSWKAALGALRPHQWAKHVLVFVPLVASHHVRDLDRVGASCIAFVAFCLVASSAYVLNDLLDLRADRGHPRKRLRAIAAGQLSILAALALFATTLAAGALVASFLSVEFQGTLAAYFALTLAYSFKLKRIVMLDVLSLAAFYTLRIIAGGFAVAAPVSFWLLAFAMFLFFSLALVKRYAELVSLAEARIDAAPGRGYGGHDTQVILSMGSASAMVSALVLALYINSETVKALYRHPDLLWLLSPLLMYWIARIWLLAARGQMNDDPVLFTIRDGASYYIAAVASFVLWLAT